MALAISQEYNENASNENTELCWNCTKYKTKDEFNTPDGENVCSECYKEYLKLCKQLNVEFIEKERNQLHYSGWFNTNVDHINVFCKKGKRLIFIRGYVPEKYAGKHKYNFVGHERGDIFKMKMQFLKTGLKYFRFYGHSDSPLEFIKYIKENNYSFGEGYNCELCKMSLPYLYEFSGNLQEVSSAFHYRIYSRTYLKEVVEALKGMKNISIKL